MPVEIVKSPTVTHVKGSLGGPMPSFKADSPAPQPTAAQPAAPPAKPVVPQKLAAAPPVPPPVTTTSKPVKPVEVNKTPAKDAMMERLRNRSNPQAAEPPKPEVTETETPAAPETQENPETTPETPETTETPATPETKPAEGKTKVNPWKLVDEWKGKATTLEQQLLEVKKLIPDESGRKMEVERLTAAEKRAQELEQEIKYVNYQKSKEFQDKYWKPYEEQYNKALGELSELEILTESGEGRKVVPADFNEILFASSLVKAKALATEKFGEYADDVMGLRKEVRRLHDEQARALKVAREEGVEREKQMAIEHSTQVTQLQSFAKETWEKAYEASLADQENGSYFKTVEGDEERNTVLKKGYELVDTSTRENPLDPNLTQEQRASIIKRHVAIRNRAAAYGVIKHELKKALTKLDEVNAKLAEYEGSTPPIEGGAPRPANGSTSGRATDRIFSKLRSLAK